MEAVYLTTKRKTDIPTHVYISSAERPSIALCEQIGVFVPDIVAYDYRWAFSSLLAACRLYARDEINISSL